MTCWHAECGQGPCSLLARGQCEQPRRLGMVQHSGSGAGKVREWSRVMVEWWRTLSTHVDDLPLLVYRWCEHGAATAFVLVA